MIFLSSHSLHTLQHPWHCTQLASGSLSKQTWIHLQAILRHSVTALVVCKTLPALLRLACDGRSPSTSSHVTTHTLPDLIRQRCCPQRKQACNKSQLHAQILNDSFSVQTACKTRANQFKWGFTSVIPLHGLDLWAFSLHTSDNELSAQHSLHIH